MMTLIIGVSGSGKSEFAEQYAVQILKNIKQDIFSSEENNLYYLATMQPFGREAEERIKKHRRMREHKGFQTIEKCRDINEMELQGSSVILLECLSNLLANEMYQGEVPHTLNEIEDKILGDIMKTASKCTHLIIVSNDIFCGGEIYEAETMHYIRMLGRLHVALAKCSDYVYEVAAGIADCRKGGPE